MHTEAQPTRGEGTGTVRCPCCGLQQPTESGAVIDHKPTRAAADDCPGSGLHPRTDPHEPSNGAVPDTCEIQLSLFDRTAAVRPEDRPAPRPRRRHRTPAEALDTDAKWAIIHARRGQFGVLDPLLPQTSKRELAAAEAEGAVHFDVTRHRPGAEDLLAPPPAVGRPVVVIPCSATKRQVPDGERAPAEDLYQGPYFTKCLTAARAIPGGRVLILSGRYGLIAPNTPIATYEKRLDPRNVDHAKHRTQVAAMGPAMRHAPEVIALAGRDYADAVAAIWPHTVRPLAGVGIGIQLQRLTRIAESADPRATALAFATAAATRP
ncbi:DUF6884 domain-containing protein [Streptomyces spirodelae]|uniref:DUF6884 domain-containing protein n=1 Tax=Streptomyces spirodelae TaxID=2812904 RepID=A0ABS3X3F0_9ACTN|nr:DUF6884 domain-containing protein [Streptomyces spirodelae]MBO8189900.1 hypothetical protein [Streptomyces spirodelae]